MIYFSRTDFFPNSRSTFLIVQSWGYHSERGVVRGEAERSGGPACPCYTPALWPAQLPSTGPQPSGGPKPIIGSWTSVHRADASTEMVASIEAGSTDFFTSVPFLKISSKLWSICPGASDWLSVCLSHLTTPVSRPSLTPARYMEVLILLWITFFLSCL